MKKGLLSVIALMMFIFAGYQNCGKAPQTYDDSSECEDCEPDVPNGFDPLQVTHHSPTADSPAVYGEVSPFDVLYTKLGPNVNFDTKGCSELAPQDTVTCETILNDHPLSAHSADWIVVSDGNFQSRGILPFQNWGVHGQTIISYFKRVGDEGPVRRDVRVKSVLDVEPAAIPANTYFHWYSSDSAGKNKLKRLKVSEPSYSNVYMIFGTGPAGNNLGTAEVCIQVVGAPAANPGDAGSPCVTNDSATTLVATAKGFYALNADNFAFDNVSRPSHYNGSNTSWLNPSHTKIKTYIRKNGVISKLSDIDVIP